jgi:hypothetical protein
MTARRGLRWAAAFALALGCGGGPREPAEESLPLASDSLEAEWADLPVAAALRDGRWAIVSGGWDAAVIADFAAGTRAPLGGPRQQAYLHPFLVFTAGDSIYLGDWGKRRTTVWSLDGRLVDSVPVVDALRGAFVRGRDAAGNFYFQVDPAPGRDGSGNQDSSAIVRSPPTRDRFDTLAYLTPRELARVTREGVTRFEQRIFSGNDYWGLWPDGTVWVARRFRNQLTTVDPRGTVTRGPLLPDPVYEVTPTDRERFLLGYPIDVRPNETDLAWALVFPPFFAAYTAPDGTVWLEKSKPALDSLRRLHVLDRGGNLQRVLLLHGDARLLAVGAGKLLVGEQFAGGVRLMEVRIPAEPSTGNR